MFRSVNYKYIRSQYEITIVDDDFTEIVVASNTFINTIVSILIDVYSRRNLNVAGNLVLLMQCIEHRWSWRNIKQQIKGYQKYVPEYSNYHDQVMDYLVFM